MHCVRVRQTGVLEDLYRSCEVNSPVSDSHPHKWPAPEFREEMLRANYANDWNSPSRACLVDAVVLVAVRRRGKKGHSGSRRAAFCTRG